MCAESTGSVASLDPTLPSLLLPPPPKASTSSLNQAPPFIFRLFPSEPSDPDRPSVHLIIDFSGVCLQLSAAHTHTRARLWGGRLCFLVPDWSPALKNVLTYTILFTRPLISQKKEAQRLQACVAFWISRSRVLRGFRSFLTRSLQILEDRVRNDLKRLKK